VLLCYCGTDSTIRNTRDFARSRCARCCPVFPSLIWWVRHSLTVHRKVDTWATEGGKYPTTSQTPFRRSTVPFGSQPLHAKASAVISRAAFALPFLYSVPSWCASPLTRILRAARSAANPISHHGPSSLSRIPLMNVSLASFFYHSRGVAESSVAPDNHRTPRITNLSSHCLHFYVSIRSTEPFVRRIAVSSSRWCLLQLSRASHEVDFLAGAAPNRTGSG